MPYILTFRRPARGVIPTRFRVSALLAVSVPTQGYSTSTSSVSAQAMDNYTTEATELVETYGLSPRSSVASKLKQSSADFLMKYIIVGPSLSSA